MSEEAAAFIETALKSKLKNTDRVEHAEKYGVLDSWWLKCPELDPVVAATIPMTSQRAESCKPPSELLARCGKPAGLRTGEGR